MQRNVIQQITMRTDYLSTEKEWRLIPYSFWHQYQQNILLYDNFIMSTSSRQKIVSNLAHVRPRSNPTNTHTRIFLFSQAQVPAHKAKCTPTFHSNVFHAANYQNEGIKRNQCYLNKTVLYSNTTKNVRQASLKHGVNKTVTLGKGIEDFQDREKETLLKKIELSNTYDRIRKNAELSSTPIIDFAKEQIIPVHFVQDIALPSN